jgi:hypothetical protein
MAISCGFKMGNTTCGKPVEKFHCGMMATTNELQVLDRDRAVQVVYLRAEHADQLLRMALGESPALLP